MQVNEGKSKDHLSEVEKILSTDEDASVASSDEVGKPFKKSWKKSHRHISY